MDAELCSPELRVIQFVPVTAFLTKGDRRHPGSRLEPSLVTAFPSEAAVSIGGAHWTDRQTDRHTTAYHVHQILMVPAVLLWLLLSGMKRRQMCPLK